MTKTETPSPQSNTQVSYEPWGEVRKGLDGKLAIFSTKFNTVKARFTPGNDSGWGLHEVLYRATPAPASNLMGAFITDLAETPLSGEPCPDDPSYTQDWTEHAGAHAIERLHDLITKARAINASAKG